MSEADDMIRKSTEVLLQMSAQMDPFFDAAKGMKARLESDGWSPTMAEQLSAEWLVGIIRKAVK